MPWLWIPPMGKLEKKVVFSPCCGDEATTYYDRAMEKAGDGKRISDLPPRKTRDSSASCDHLA